MNDTKREMITGDIVKRQNEILVEVSAQLQKQTEKLNKLLDNRGKDLILTSKAKSTSVHLKAYQIENAQWNDNGQIEICFSGSRDYITLDKFDITIINSVERI